MAEQRRRFDLGTRWWPLAAGVVLGLLAGLLVSLLTSGTRRAEASVLISSPAGPAAVTPQLPNLRELATSSVVAGNVRSTLRLSQSTENVRSHLRATVRPGAQVIAVSATDDVAEHARQIAQEAATVFAQLVEGRFGTGTPQLHAAVLDSGHVLGKRDRHVARNLLIGGILGLLVGSAAMFVLAGGAPRPGVAAADDGDLENRERLLERRLSSVSARERALAVHAGKLSARELELEARAAKLDASERERAASVETPPPPTLPPPPTPTPPPTLPPPPPQPVDEPAPIEPEILQPVSAGAWNLRDLQTLVATATDASPEQMDEWRTYLFFLREHAAHDGALPRSFDPLIGDVFAGLLEGRPPA